MKSIIAFVVIFGVAVSAAIYLLSEENRTLPVLNPVDVNSELVDPSVQNKGMNHKILDFYLVNQDGKWVDNKVIDGKIVVVNFFFTTCPTICPIMNGKILKVNNEFKDTKKVMILSHTVWPEVDSVPLLKEYEGRFEADASTWMFLTGDKKHLYDLARKSYFVAPDLNNQNYEHGSENDFIHTENVVLIDTKGQIRGYYDGTSDLQVDQLIEDIELLLHQ